MRQPWPWFALALALTTFGFWPSFFSNLDSVRSLINERTAILLFPDLVPNLSVGRYAALISMEVIWVALIIAERRFDRVRWPIPFMRGSGADGW